MHCQPHRTKSLKNSKQNNRNLILKKKKKKYTNTKGLKDFSSHLYLIFKVAHVRQLVNVNQYK